MIMSKNSQKQRVETLKTWVEWMRKKGSIKYIRKAPVSEVNE
jgi:hypothetical protein